MSIDFGTAIVAAILASVFTLGLGKLALDRYGERYARKQLDLAAAELEQRFRAAAAQAAEEMLPELQRRVRAGVEEALHSFAEGKPLEKTMEQAAKAGLRALNEGLESLMGRKRP
jgi:hypothetical protein